MPRRLFLVAAALALVAGSIPVGAAAPKPVVPASLTVPASWFGGATPPLAPGQIELAVTSTLPATVTGEEARVEVRGIQPTDVLSVKRDATDVTAALAPSGPGVVDGVVTGLRHGGNHLTAVATGPAGTRTATLEVTDHPVTGPVISGPHQSPFICETEKADLGKPLDGDCSVATRFDWYYRSTDGQFHHLDNPYAPYPSDTATATTTTGQRVPFVARVESATINRSITRVAVLDDPAKRGPKTPYQPSAGWNHRLIYSFGESCGTGFHQGVNAPDDVLGQVPNSNSSTENAFATVLDLADQLGKGYMTTNSTLTILGVDCNDVLSAETLMMVKEHIVDDYGKLVHTIGAGASGGAIQQYTAANNYPGLIDAATPVVSFPDIITTAMTVGDCYLLDRVFAADPTRWTEAKRDAITGHRSSQICADWDSLFAPNLDPQNCDSSIPRDMVYDPKRNPNGVRCTVQEDQVNVWGRDPATGFARRPLDNTGVQYGLTALQRGAISLRDFIDLNAVVGGVDIDGHPILQRMDMGADLARIAYQTGRVTGRGALAQTPLIDNHPYVDTVPEADIHDQDRPFMARARLDAHAGGHGSQAIWQGLPAPFDGFAPAETWLTAIEAAGPAAPRAATVAAARPPTASDRCGGPLGLAVPGTKPCDAVVGASPRIVAGGPPAEDVVKCGLKAVDPADYKVATTGADVTQLRRIFPTGVCDWGAPGAGEVPASGVWLSFGDSQLATHPVALQNVVARSALAGTAAAGATAVAGLQKVGGGTLPHELPATGGGARWAALGVALVLAALALRTRRAATAGN